MFFLCLASRWSCSGKRHYKATGSIHRLQESILNVLQHHSLLNCVQSQKQLPAFTVQYSWDNFQWKQFKPELYRPVQAAILLQQMYNSWCKFKEVITEMLLKNKEQNGVRKCLIMEFHVGGGFRKGFKVDYKFLPVPIALRPGWLQWWRHVVCCTWVPALQSCPYCYTDPRIFLKPLCHTHPWREGERAIDRRLEITRSQQQSLKVRKVGHLDRAAVSKKVIQDLHKHFMASSSDCVQPLHKLWKNVPF